MNPEQQQPVMPPTNDFLSRMDMVNMPQPTEPEKKGPSRNAIIGIVVGESVLIGAVIGIIMMLSPEKTEPRLPGGYSQEDDDPENPDVDEELEARNELRADDLLAVKKAVNAYQAAPAADGQLPGPEVEEWEWMIKNYSQNGEVKDGADGSVYTVGAVCKFGESCVDISSLTWENDKHKIFALYNADCKGKTKENVIVSSTRKRRVAIFAIIENDQFICTTNGN
ncbi:hypothetical protein J6X90_01035 [Candidatus Saccharibacteria bacterium]|nr:hypothetical protein [Candidatus Saccharibacteria bacterium]